MNLKQAFYAVAYRELENVLSQIRTDEDVVKLFDGSTSIQLPISIHQDMLNAVILNSLIPPDQPTPQLLQNGVQLAPKEQK